MSDTVLLFYKYIQIDEPEEVRDEQRALCEKLNLRGRILVAEEGINGTLEGKTELVEEYIKEMNRDQRFVDIDFKKSPGTGSAFPRLSVKVKKEIVKSTLSEDINPNSDTGTYIDPDELHKWYEEGKDFTVIDMRNNYEFVSGHFEGAVDPGLGNFRDLKEKISDIEYLKEKPVVTVCTGGVRCEKASAYLKSEGFENVFQLKGGIHRYIEKYPGEHFKGGLYVFDGRVVIDTAPPEKKVIVGTCVFCEAPTENYADDDSVIPSRQILCCEECFATHNSLRRARKESTKTSHS